MFYMKLLRYFVLILLFALGAYFCLANSAAIEIQIPKPWARTFSVSAGLCFIIAFTLGAAVTCGHVGYEYFRKSMQVRKLGRQLKKIEVAGNESTEVLP